MMKKDKLEGKSDIRGAKPAKVRKEPLKKRIKEGYVAPSSPKDSKPGKIYDTTIDTDPKKGGSVNKHGDIPKGKSKSTKKGK